jgi:DNA-binding transcriptional LysR family regulator
MNNRHPWPATANPEPLADLHLLTVLAQTRSYTQAARRLGVSKASVSMRIAELERAAGVPLVRRTTRSVGLTDAGQQLVDDTQRLSAHRTEFCRRQGPGRLAARAGARERPVALGRQHVAPTLPAFLRRYPDIRLELDLNDRS